MVIVVEGKNDASKILNNFPEALVITTNGSEVSEDTIKSIEIAAQTSHVVLCLDPDGPGEKIRKLITSRVKNVDHVYAQRDKAIDHKKHKVGIEHMKNEEILKMFSHIYTPNKKGTVTFEQLYDLGLMTSKSKRIFLCNNLHLGYCNAKQLLKRINEFNINIEEVKKNI